MEWRKTGSTKQWMPPRGCKTALRTPGRRCSVPSKKRGFTLIEVILVVVIAVILLGVSLPHFSRTYKGSVLRSAARTITRMTRYARSMAIMRETTMTVVLNADTGEIYLGGPAQTTTNTADGELDQDVLKRLGYKEGDTSAGSLGIDKEIHRFLHDIEVIDFEKDWVEGDEDYEHLHFIRYYSDGQSDWFVLELQGRSGLGIKLESDPISGKIFSEFTQ